jgi:cytochrome c-type biogenesis protein CcmH
MTPEQQQEMIRGMVEGLAKRLEANPNDLEGWKRLGQSYFVLNEPVRARDAYARAVARRRPIGICWLNMRNGAGGTDPSR